jgi:RNA binding exosome subunit
MPTVTHALEEAIIGRVIMESHYMEVAHILRPVCFSSEQHQRIWQVLQHMFPTQGIDLLTVAHEYRKRYTGDNIAPVLVACTNRTATGHNLREHCFRLLEISIRQRTVEHLASREKHHTTTHRHDIAQVLTRCREAIANPLADLYEELTTASSYMQACGLTTEHDMFQEYALLMDRSALQMKRAAQTHAVMNHLHSITRKEGDQAVAQALDIIQSMIIDLLAHDRINTDYLNQLYTTAQYEPKRN